jgi:hypothetical protein
MPDDSSRVSAARSKRGLSRGRVLLFRPYFGPRIRLGTKIQTIRRTPKRPIFAGDLLSLREWGGKPYRSPQIEIILPVRCSSIVPILIERRPLTTDLTIRVGGEWLWGHEREEFAQDDGFPGLAQMGRYYDAMKVELLEGVLISWHFSERGPQCPTIQAT